MLVRKRDSCLCGAKLCYNSDTFLFLPLLLRGPGLNLQPLSDGSALGVWGICKGVYPKKNILAASIPGGVCLNERGSDGGLRRPSLRDRDATAEQNEFMALSVQGFSDLSAQGGH